MSFFSSNNSNKWKDVPVRLGTIVIGIPLLWMLWLDDSLRWIFWESVHLLVLYEYTYMANCNAVGMGLSSLILTHSPSTETQLCLLVFFTAIATLSARNSNNNRTITETTYLQGWMMISVPFSIWLRLSSSSTYGFVRTVSLLLTVWNCDTGALVAGRLVGGKLFGKKNLTLLRHELNTISPKKSVEGLIGGLILGTLTYASLPHLYTFLNSLQFVPLSNVTTVSRFRRTSSQVFYDLTFGLVLSIAAILGDLWESKLKRQYNVKDTSKALPGHGGILDRFDSSLLSVLVYHFILNSRYYDSHDRGY